MWPTTYNLLDTVETKQNGMGTEWLYRLFTLMITGLAGAAPALAPVQDQEREEQRRTSVGNCRAGGPYTHLLPQIQLDNT